LNSRPGGTTHSYLTQGFINAKRIAPWYTLTPGTNDESDGEEQPMKASQANESASSNLISAFNAMKLFDGEEQHANESAKPRMRYLLDAGLNKLCRWLRILGQDAALETEEEEKLRTGQGQMVIFERCVKEQRTLVTTSPRLMQRRDCPSSVYCIHPPFLSKLEVALVHLLLTHGVILEPSTFLSRCVVCNGNIVEVLNDEEKRRILREYEAPLDLIEGGMAVYECDGCQQGYWWNELPTSSASRVKTAATRLFELCVRGGVPICDEDDSEGLFGHVNIPKLQKLGWDDETPGSELLRQRLDIVNWLKQEHLECPFELESAYAVKTEQTDGSMQTHVTGGERLPFTNVTHQFVDTLDYIFFEKRRFVPIELFYVPTSFVELSCGRKSANAHLLPSDIWPSDHLAIGARLAFLVQGEKDSLGRPDASVKEDQLQSHSRAGGTVAVAKSVEPTLGSTEMGDSMQYCVPIGHGNGVPPPSLVKPSLHESRCGCGCVPQIPSLFEMAEMRKQAKLEKRRLA
jgi:uncharacterized protein with PIN domain